MAGGVGLGEAGGEAGGVVRCAGAATVVGAGSLAFSSMARITTSGTCASLSAISPSVDVSNATCDCSILSTITSPPRPALTRRMTAALSSTSAARSGVASRKSVIVSARLMRSSRSLRVLHRVSRRLS